MLFKRQLSYIHLKNSGKLTILTYKSNNFTNFDESHVITGNGSTTNMLEENREISGRGSGRDDDDFGVMLFKRQLSYLPPDPTTN